MERDAVIVAGFGCRASATAESLAAAFAAAAQGRSVDRLAAPADRVALLAPLARALGVPVVPITDAALAATVTPTRSPASVTARGTGSVAEATALHAAGPGARLLTTRLVSPDRRATCALAIGTS
ncbi:MULTISPECIES: cobalamin biosynthesis protein [unclassified Sphingomonas]|uniref:cobalamin biosynthesis protein n=1 Tax=unclassified Sphingomonas TaxID=196159 RepID=UPI0017DD5E53|nr:MULTISPECIES: cobalamin biosynthesis protein [unclassified Sphingomonas]MBB3346567.1 cobalt-precorrin 5A hydrolase [Sphingomonas sp. BK069]MBB3473117.1 cobalt-precorrin 5A hydrolase [Sphingomonas sp. BK345]